jgi:hypothetical protein
MEPIAEALRALFAEPMALVMALVALVCAVAAVTPSRRHVRDRLLTVALALISGTSAWMMATRWRWPD